MLYNNPEFTLSTSVLIVYRSQGEHDCAQTLAQSPICLELEEEEKEREGKQEREGERDTEPGHGQEQEAPWEIPIATGRGGANAREGEGQGGALWRQNLRKCSSAKSKVILVSP